MNRIVAGILVLGAAGVSGAAQAVPIQTLGGLASITVWERTGAGPNPFVFAPGGSALTTVRSNPLSGGNTDIGAAEPYDLFYSNANGSFNANGAFLTITAVYPVTAGGALNIAGVQLNFAGANASAFGGANSELANVVTHVIALGNTANAASAANAVDGVSSTHSAIGDTAGLPIDQRLSLTVGFEASKEVPVPAAAGLLGTAVAGLVGLKGAKRLRRRRNATA